MVPYTLVRSRRKTLALVISREGELVVRAPLRASKAWIESFIQEKEPWIREKQAEIHSRRDCGITGETDQLLPFRGETLTIAAASVPQVERQGALLLVPEGAGPEEIAGWLRKQAAEALPALLERRAKELGVSYTGFHLSEARRSWGSCTAKGAIRLSWRLLMCPPELADYVAVHELCHLRHMDHSPDFWAAVEAACPDCLTCRQQLRKDYGWLMELF